MSYVRSIDVLCLRGKWLHVQVPLQSKVLPFNKFWQKLVVIKRALQYPLNWIRFIEINKLRNVITENLTFSINRKLISISWNVWTCSNFSTNWKWKWMNRIQHESKNVVVKQKVECIWKIMYLYKSTQFTCY